MGQIDCPETSVRNYYYFLRNNPEERSSLLILQMFISLGLLFFEELRSPDTSNICSFFQCHSRSERSYHIKHQNRTQLTWAWGSVVVKALRY